MARKVTKRQAEQALAAISKQFHAEEGYGPTLVMDFDWMGTGASPAIVWEEGPFEWTYRAFQGGVDEELTAEIQEFRPGAVIHNPPATEPAGVWAEPVTSWALGLYPA